MLGAQKGRHAEWKIRDLWRHLKGLEIGKVTGRGRGGG